MNLEEQAIDCPYCGEPIVILVDPSEALQAYIEDCQVCCRPMEISVGEAEDGGIGVSVRAEDDTS